MVNRNLLRQFDPDESTIPDLEDVFHDEITKWIESEEQDYESNKIVTGRVLEVRGDDVVIDIGALLWTFNDPRIWHYGSGLLASAGIASLILATAAKSTAANFLAGMQIALTEPIRIDDVVVIQGEWGRIEEINSAYVVVKIWDLRRLIVPLSYFIENSFQNWTRESSDIMGTAFLYVDYSIPVEDLRKHLGVICPKNSSNA